MIPTCLRILKRSMPSYSTPYSNGLGNKRATRRMRMKRKGGREVPIERDDGGRRRRKRE